MLYLIFCFLTAFVISVVLARPVSRLAAVLGALDLPNERKHHVGAVSRLGGLGFFAAFAISSIPLMLHGSLLLLRLLSAGLLMLALGISDDIFSLGAWHKLTAQCAVAWALWAMGVRIYGLSLFGYSLSLGTLASAVITVFTVVMSVNAVNFIDGMDSLATLVCLATLFSLAMVARAEHDPAVFICASLIGALVGFLPYNISRASSFMGDSGSTFLGLSLATLSISELSGVLDPSFAFLMLVPLGNMAFVIVRRLWRRKSLFSSDRLHIHHYLCDCGMSELAVVLLLSLLSLFASLFAVAVNFM